jgi:hypothetical protein
MRFYIVNRWSETPLTEGLNYRGVIRGTPEYRSELAPEHEVNRAYRELMNHIGTDLGLGDISVAREVCLKYAQSFPSDGWEVIALVEQGEVWSGNGTLLGVDLTCGDSLITKGILRRRDFLPGTVRAAMAELFTDYSGASALMELISRYFRERLNENVLFPDVYEAEFCRECMLELQECRPNLYEGSADFRIVSVYLVPLAD